MEVSKGGNLYESLVVVSPNGRANPLTDRKVVEVVFSCCGCNGYSGHLATTAGCDVVSCSCSCNMVELQLLCGAISVVSLQMHFWWQGSVVQWSAV